MKQNCLTILSPVSPSNLPALDQVLREIGDDIAGQSHISFPDLTLLHFASWVIFDDSNQSADFGEPYPQLIFESNFDGTPEDFLGQLISGARDGIEHIYRHVKDYPAGADADAVRQYFLSHSVRAQTFYASCGGFTRDRIMKEEWLREKIEAMLGAADAQDNPVVVRWKIQQFVKSDPALEWALDPAAPWKLGDRFRARDLGTLALLLAGLTVLIVPGFFIGWFVWLPILAAATLALYLRFRFKEATEPSLSDIPVEDVQPDLRDLQGLLGRENRKPQNHLAAITTVKPGPVRAFLLRAVLTAIDFLGRVVYYKGSLHGIPSIHFARWAIVNGGRHLVFLSNFDESWEHYLDEFIDQACNGLTAVWTNCVNFPRTRNLVQGGAADEQRFKAYARYAQVYTQLWYSAYPSLSVACIQNNAAIRAGLGGDMNAAETEAWLGRF